MSTRAQVRFATRESGISFNEIPNAIHAQFYVHSDGYPEGLGVEIAESLTKYQKIMHWEIESLDAEHSDLEYIYVVWQAPGKSTWISIFEVSFPHMCELCYYEHPAREHCIFVGEPCNLISRYKPNTNKDG
tara:strand:+ start:261 stop:653 length:393 start_codon:yes stop_codon:yes gene_type:complete